MNFLTTDSHGYTQIMKKNKNRLSLCLGMIGISLLLSACGPKASDENTAKVESNLLDRIQVLDTKPEGALSVKAAREQLNPGEEAFVFGQIGGVDQPFLEGYAGFVLGDTDLVFCGEMGNDDHCPTPWDACCEDTDTLKASRASVQFVDASGQAIAASMKGFAEVKELSPVVVQGTVAESSTPDNLIIEARGLYVGE